MARKIKKSKGNIAYEQDWFMKVIEETSTYVREKYVTLIVAFAAVLVVILAIYLANAAMAAKKFKSASGFAKALSAMNATVEGKNTPFVNPDTETFETDKAKYEEAVKRLMAVRDNYPKSEEAKLVPIELGTAYLRLGEYDKAINELKIAKTLLADQPDMVELADFDIGMAYVGKGDLTSAVASFKSISAKDDGLLRGQATLQLAFVLEKKGDLKQALEAYQKLADQFAEMSVAQGVNLKIATLKKELGITDEDEEEMKPGDDKTGDDKAADDKGEDVKEDKGKDKEASTDKKDEPQEGEKATDEGQ